MPTLSLFYGVVIRIFYDDHSPPHFHAVYGDHELLVSIDPITILRGNAPARVESMVLERAALHQGELREDWGLCAALKPPNPVAPLQ